MRMNAKVLALCTAAVLSGVLFNGSSARASEGEPTVVAALAELDTPGGLAVQLGTGQLDVATELARTGRFVVQLLDDDAQRVEQLRKRLSG